MESITDPSDWKGGLLAALESLDSLLRCQICRDFYTAAVTTSCLHTFCSLCIRRSLDIDHLCPICRSQEQEGKLRKNPTVQDITDVFNSIRPALLQANNEKIRRAHKMETRLKRKREENGNTSLSESSSQETKVYEAKVEIPEGHVICPICSSIVKESDINLHVDKCLKKGDSDSRPKVNAEMIRLPKLNYSLLNEARLRSKLSEQGLSSTGNKKALEKRYTEWINIWNSNLDSNNPKTKREMIRELNSCERIGNSGAKNEIDCNSWAKEHKKEFEDLAKLARRSQQNK